MNQSNNVTTGHFPTKPTEPHTYDQDIGKAHADPNFNPANVTALILECDVLNISGPFPYEDREGNVGTGCTLHAAESGDLNYSAALTASSDKAEELEQMTAVLQALVHQANEEPVGSKVLRVTFEVVDA